MEHELALLAKEYADNHNLDKEHAKSYAMGYMEAYNNKVKLMKISSEILGAIQPALKFLNEQEELKLMELLNKFEEAIVSTKV